MTDFLDELRAMEEKLRGIKAPAHEGAGHHFKKSGLSKKVRGQSDKAPPEIYRANMGDDDA